MSSGGKGNSRSTTQASTQTTTKQTTINTVDNRAVQGDNAVVGGNITINPGESNQINVSTSDLGAIKGGLDLALESIRGIQDATSNSTEALKSVTSDSIGQAYGLANSARQSSQQELTNNFLKFAAVIAVVGIIGWVIVKAKK